MIHHHQSLLSPRSCASLEFV
uniref:Uncharacterized protein n=1 Tax=Salix viminalis TaxID=40686 RepID=A0A6N2LFS6_SALVM